MKNNYINILLISGSGLIGGLINYIYHPLMLRYMTLEEFGEFGTLAGLFSILSIFTAGIGLFLTKEVSRNIGNAGHIKHIFLSSSKVLGSIGGVLFLFYLAITPLLSRFLDISIPLLAMTGIVILTSFLGVGIGSTLTGMRKFEFLGLSGITHPITKFILGGGTVYLGYSIFGALFGFVMSGVLSLLLSFFYVSYLLKDDVRTGNSMDILRDFQKSKISILNFLIVSVLFSFLVNGDVILARHIFSPEVTGIYAGVSIVGKFLLYMLLSIETVYYGQVMEHERRELPRHLVKNALIIMATVSALAIVVNVFLGAFVLSFLKVGLSDALHIYLLLLGYYAMLAFISIFSKILVGWGVYRVNIYLAILCSSIALSLLFLHHSGLETFILTLLGNIFVGIVFIGSLFWKELSRHIR